MTTTALYVGGTAQDFGRIPSEAVLEMIQPNARKVWAFGLCYHEVCYARDCWQLVGIIRQVQGLSGEAITLLQILPYVTSSPGPFYGFRDEPISSATNWRA